MRGAPPRPVRLGGRVQGDAERPAGARAGGRLRVDGHGDGGPLGDGHPGGQEHGPGVADLVAGVSAVPALPPGRTVTESEAPARPRPVHRVSVGVHGAEPQRPGRQLPVGAALADAVLAVGDVVGGLADLERPHVERRAARGEVRVRPVAPGWVSLSWRSWPSGPGPRRPASRRRRARGRRGRAGASRPAPPARVRPSVAVQQPRDLGRVRRAARDAGPAVHERQHVGVDAGQGQRRRAGRAPEHAHHRAHDGRRPRRRDRARPAAAASTTVAGSCT